MSVATRPLQQIQIEQGQYLQAQTLSGHRRKPHTGVPVNTTGTTTESRSAPRGARNMIWIETLRAIDALLAKYGTATLSLTTAG